MYGYVYLSRNKLNDMKYVGQKVSGSFCRYYFGSGAEISKDIKKYGRESFEIFIILKICETPEELNYWEQYWIDQLDAVNRTDYYNKSRITHGKGNTPESRDKVSNQVKGRVWMTNGEIEKQVLPEQADYLIAQGFRRGRKSLSLESKRRMSESHKGKKIRTVSHNKGKPNVNRGKQVHTDEQKELWSEMRSDMVWMNRNGVNTTVHPHQIEDHLSMGFKFGMIRRAPVHNVGRICINNGVTNKYIYEDQLNQYLSEGWVRGGRKAQRKKRR